MAANKHHPRQPGYDKADLEQVALAALWVSAQRYDSARGPFAAFAGRAVMRQVRRHLHERRSKPLPQAPLVEVGDGPGMLDQVEARTEGDRAEREETMRQVRELGNQELPEREWRILRRRFVLDGDRTVPTEEIAAELDVTPQHVRQLVARGLAQLRQVCEDRGLSVDVVLNGVG